MSFVINDPDYSEDDSEFNPSFDEQEDESEKRISKKRKNENNNEIQVKSLRSSFSSSLNSRYNLRKPQCEVIDLTAEVSQDESLEITLVTPTNNNSYRKTQEINIENCILSCNEKPIRNWCCEDVLKWLDLIGFQKYKFRFKKNDINGKHLLNLSNNELQNDLRISSLGHRMDILKEIEQLRARNTHEEGGSNPSPTKPLNIIQNGEEEIILNKIVAKGSFGTVWNCMWNNQECAIKIMNTSELVPAILKRVKEEISILKNLKHENIVKYLFDFEKEESNEIYLIMELCNMSLFQRISFLRDKNSSFSCKEFVHSLINISKGIEYLHTLEPFPIIHRDLKSKNILINLASDGSGISNCKLCDFGVSKVISDSTMAHTLLGTPRWVSPEILSKSEGGYTKNTDIWSFGMVIYEMLSLRSPYYEVSNPEEITNNILDGVLPTLPPALSPKYKPFQLLMEQCLRLKPELRPSAEEIVFQLESTLQPQILKQETEVENPNNDCKLEESTLIEN